MKESPLGFCLNVIQDLGWNLQVYTFSQFLNANMQPEKKNIMQIIPKYYSYF